MKLAVGAEKPARIAKSSWLTPRAVRHSRSRWPTAAPPRPDASDCTEVTIRPCYAGFGPRSITSQVIASYPAEGDAVLTNRFQGVEHMTPNRILTLNAFSTAGCAIAMLLGRGILYSLFG